MSKTSILLLFILLCVIGVFIYYNKSYQESPTVFTKAAPTITPKQGLTTIFLDKRKTDNSDFLLIDARVNTIEKETQVIQLEIGYDPTVLTINSIKPGTYFNNPLVLLKNINEHLGRISYALRCQKTSQSPCVNNQTKSIATISFTPTEQTLQDQTSITLLPKTFMKTSADHLVDLHLHNVQIMPEISKKSVASDSANKKVPSF